MLCRDHLEPLQSATDVGDKRSPWPCIFAGAATVDFAQSSDVSLMEERIGSRRGETLVVPGHRNNPRVGAKQTTPARSARCRGSYVPRLAQQIHQRLIRVCGFME